MSRLLSLAVLLATGGAVAQTDALRPADRPPARTDAVLRWNEEALTAIRTARTPPPVAARNLAMMHVAAFDAVNAVTLTHRPYEVYVTAPAGTDPGAAAAAAAHRVLTALYPGQAVRLDAALNDSLAGLPPGRVRADSLQIGRFVADRILEARRDDGSGREATYTLRPGPGLWQPTPPGYRPALLPQWGKVATFSTVRMADIDPGPSPAMTTPEYTAAFKEVKSLGAINSPTRTAEQAIIAWFWADDEGTVTPPGHWNRIAQDAARQRGLSLEDNARLFALLNVALADAAVACWDCKFKYGVWRPVHAIRQADQTGNPDTEPDRTWTPLLTTPPFPSYSSGHSTFSGAAAAVLAKFFGTDAFRFTATSEGMPGVSRSFNSFSAAAEEAGRSRIYGGIHYEFDNQQGLRAGRRIGELVCRTLLLPREDRPRTELPRLLNPVPVPAPQR
jgi:hypothetical protein